MKKLMHCLLISTALCSSTAMAAQTEEIPFKNISGDVLSVAPGTGVKAYHTILTCDSYTLAPHGQVNCRILFDSDHSKPWMQSVLTFKKGGNWCSYAITGTYNSTKQNYDIALSQPAPDFIMTCTNEKEGGSYLVGFSRAYNKENRKG